MSNQMNERELVLDILLEVLEKNTYIHYVLNDVLTKYQYLEKNQRAFITRLSEGTVERLLEMDYVINQFSKVKVNKMKPVIRTLLRMSVYQLFYMDAVPDSAVCNEAVKLAGKRGLRQLGGFVNGVLRNIARNKDAIVWPKDALGALEVKYSIPRWILSQWETEYGKDQMLAIAKGFTEKEQAMGLTVRTNLDQITTEELMAKLEAEQVGVRKLTLTQPFAIDYALELTGIDYLNGMESFLNGDFYIQDVSSMMVAEAVAPTKGDYVIDVCAAPGGKSTHVAQKLAGTGHVEARDLTEMKVSLIEENIARCGCTNMSARVWDATVLDEASVQKADVVICDVPCSGLGVMGKKTDIRYRMTKETEDELVLLQRQILQTVAEYVKPGKTLVYSTCTIHKAENEDNVAWFLKEHTDFTLEMQKQIFPGEIGNDGFFLAKLVKRM